MSDSLTQALVFLIIGAVIVAGFALGVFVLIAVLRGPDTTKGKRGGKRGKK